MRFSIISAVGFLSIASLLSGAEILIPNAHGDLVYLEADPHETIEELQIRAELEPASILQNEEAMVPMSFERDFYAGLSVQEMDDIRYIVRYLSDNNEIKIFINQSHLDSTGDRIHHVHPLAFLKFVFSDPDLKVKVRNIKGKSLVWRGFIGGIKGSLNDEYYRNNLLSEHYEDMARHIGIKISELDHSIKRADWDELVNALIKFVTHDTGADRYNM